MEIPVVSEGGYSAGGKNLRILFGKILILLSPVFVVLFPFIGMDCFNILN